MHQEILDLRPDFVFTIDHNGLDPQLLSEIKIPFVSWFCDNPFYWSTKRYLSSYYLIFCSDPEIFNQMVGYKQEGSYQANVSFVGSSGRSHYLDYYQKYEELVKDPKDRMVCDKALEIQSENPLLNWRYIRRGQEVPWSFFIH